MRFALLVPLLACTACLSSPESTHGVEPVGIGIDGTTPVPAGAPRDEAHLALASLVGSWSVTITGSDGSGVGGGEAALSMVHGGRFLRLDLDLVLREAAVRSSGHLGYDPLTSTWQALWLSDLSDRMSLLEGRGNLDRGVRLAGEQAGVRGRSVITLEGPNRLVVRAYGAGTDGRDVLLRTSEYLRK